MGEECIYCALVEQYSGKGESKMKPIPAQTVDGYEFLDSLRNHMNRNQ